MKSFNKRRGQTVAAFLTILIAASCSQSNTSPDPGTASKQSAKPRVLAVNCPLMYFAERIGGSTVDVDFPIPADIDPAFWEPNADEVARVQKADLILLNGANYARWTKRVSLPESMSVNTTSNLKEQYIRIQDATVHQHGPSGKHTHAGYAFTTWFDLKIAVEQARAVKDGLAQLLPQYQSTYQAHFAELERELLQLDKQIEQAAAKNPQQPLVGSHPVYQYFSKRYGLNLKSVHWEPDETPGDAAWKEFKAFIAKHPAKTMLWEGEPNKDIVAKLDGMGITSVVFNPCDNRPATGDFLEVMRSNVERFAAIFQVERDAK